MEPASQVTPATPAAAPRVTVTIRCERDDGQFTVAQTTVPGDLAEAGRWQQRDAEDKIADGFAEAYQRLMGLPS